MSKGVDTTLWPLNQHKTLVDDNESGKHQDESCR